MTNGVRLGSVAMADKLWHSVSCPAAIPAVWNRRSGEFETRPCTCGYDEEVKLRKENDNVKPDKKLLLAPGSWNRLSEDQNNWCHDCQKSTLRIANVASVSDDGVTHWGTVIACTECLAHEFRNEQGEKIAVNIHKNPGSEPY